MGTVMPDEVMKSVPPQTVANFVAFLCHESCPATGAVFELAGRFISRLRWERSAGVVMPENFSVDDVAENFADICDMSNNTDHPPEEGRGSVEKALAIAKAEPAAKL